MTRENKTSADLAELERMLDTFGGDDARWPATARARLRPLLATSTEAKRLLAEARAVDKVLDAVGTRSANAPPALADAIMAAVAREEPARAPPSVVPFQARPTRRDAASTQRTAPQWQWAAVMAASLVLGVTVGISTDIGSSLRDVAEAVGLSGDLGTVSLVFNDAFSGFDEDLL